MPVLLILFFCKFFYITLSDFFGSVQGEIAFIKLVYVSFLEHVNSNFIDP